MPFYGKNSPKKQGKSEKTGICPLKTLRRVLKNKKPRPKAGAK
jgi:hypothetical protein